MFESRLLAALAAGSTVVTPNKRLARTLVATYDNAQRAAGRRTWTAAQALPWAAWLEQLWHDVLAHDALPSITRLLRAPQARWRWRQIVAAHSAALSDVRGAAALAADAWAISKAWGSGGESWRGWRNDALPDDDCAAYAGWAERFHAALGHMRAVDDASLADVLVTAIDAIEAWRNLDIVLAGFIEPTPQQERLLAALAKRGARIARCNTIADLPIEATCTSAGSPRDEILFALTWARNEAMANPGATIGIAVEDLASRRDEVVALADDVLCPALQLPGHEGETRPYNVSLGLPLASTPLVAAALGWIELSTRLIAIAQAAGLVRSPYLPDATTQWPRRASLEKAWLELGRREIGCSDAATALERVDPAFGERLRRALAMNRYPTEASPREWIDLWRGWLAAIGWPGDRPLGSAEQQTREAFDGLLANFAAMAAVDERMRMFDALNALRDVGNDTLFQQESPPVPIQIVGLLEATGLPFDRLWIAGLASDRWPRAPQPHPLLPLAWQRDHEVPRSSAPRELRFARKTTALLLHGAPRVVVSYARNVDDQPRRVSQLIAELKLPELTPINSRIRYLRAIHDSAPSLDALADHRAPPLAEGVRIRGGAHAIEAQGNCPFQAVALHRLNTDQWPRTNAGLTPIERGILVHAAFAAFWNDIRDSATLATLDDSTLTARIALVAESAHRALKEERWRWIPPIIAAGEAPRLAALLRRWIEGYERTRAPFAVEATEVQIELTLAGVPFRLRMDRVDRVPGGAVIIDYKTGFTLAPKAWFDPRPRAPQLGLYALARRHTAQESPTCAVAYAQLNAGALKLNGVRADIVAWPALMPIEKTEVRSWPALEAWWETHLTALAEELRTGVADVSPRDGAKTCRTCRLQALCRIGGGALGLEDGVDG
ncbi:MAG TPA: PD-(D/E)XK nuclease family protein [Casimicrobiaceae bacterium]|jgi:probable DNA repair protein